jgi:hypothetical protein
MGVRVLAVTFSPDFAVPSVCTEDVGHPALPTKMPTFIAVRALVPRSLVRCVAIFGGAGG